MGYLHRWDYKTKQPFSDEFIRDVREVIMDNINILEDVHVSDEYIRFNGKGDYGCETFILHHENYYNSVKTGTFSVADYDIVVSSVLLLLYYHYPNTELHCDGLMTICIDKETLGVNMYFDNAFCYIKEEFGYEFKRELTVDEYGQDMIVFETTEKNPN